MTQKTTRKKMGLRLSLTLFIILPSVIFMSAATYVGLQSLEARLKAYMQEDVELVARALKVPVARAVRENDIIGAKKTVKSILDIDQLYGAYLYNSKGKLVFSAGVDRPKQKIPRPSDKGDGQGEYTNLKKRRVYSYVVPLAHKNLGTGDVGFLQVVRRKSDIYKSIIHFRLISIFAIISIWATVLFIISIFYKYWILKPVSELKKGFQQVGKGQVKFQLKSQSTNEFQFLINSFNKMVQNLKQSREESEARGREKLLLEQKLQQSAKLASLGELSAGVAHELGTPLSVIDAKIQRAQRKPIKSQQITPFLNSLREETQKMIQIVQDLLNFSSPTHHEVQTETISFKNCLRQAIKSATELSPHNLSYIHVSEPQEDVFLQASSLRLEQAFINLIKNALDATKDKNLPEINVFWEVHDKTLTCKIKDNGPGIKASEKAKVFEPFFTTKRPGLGTGLGLSVTYTIITELGGDIEFQTSDSVGACCILKFFIDPKLQKGNTYESNTYY